MGAKRAEARNSGKPDASEVLREILERLDYTPGKKAEIKALVATRSGELARLRAEAEESRKVKGREAAAKQHKSKPVGVRQVAATLPDPKPDHRKTGTAAKLAKQAGVSQRTMERPAGCASASQEGDRRRGGAGGRGRGERGSAGRQERPTVREIVDLLINADYGRPSAVTPPLPHPLGQ